MEAANLGRMSSATFINAALLLASEINNPAAIFLAASIETTFLWVSK